MENRLLFESDVIEAIDKHMVMTNIHLVEKTGGKSGDFHFGDDSDSQK